MEMSQYLSTWQKLAFLKNRVWSWCHGILSTNNFCQGIWDHVVQQDYSKGPSDVSVLLAVSDSQFLRRGITLHIPIFQILDSLPHTIENISINIMVFVQCLLVFLSLSKMCILACTKTLDRPFLAKSHRPSSDHTRGEQIWPEDHCLRK